MKIVERHGSVVRSDSAICLESTCGWAVSVPDQVVDEARRHAGNAGHPVRLTRTRSVVLVDLRHQAPA